MNGFLETMKTGVNRIQTDYKKNRPFWLKTVAIFGTVVIAGVTYTEAPAIHDAFKQAAKEWKEANEPKEKAVIAVETAGKVAVPMVKIIVTIGGTIYCIEKSYKEQHTQIVTLAMMAAGSQIELDDLRAATKEVVGQKKADQIEERVAQKQFDRIKQNGVEFSDVDASNPDTILDTETGALWHDKYINVLDAIGAYYDEAKTGSEVFYPWSILYSHLNYGKDGNSIRIGKSFEDFGVMQCDLKNIKHSQDMIKVVQAGPNMYKLVRLVKKRPNPDGYTDEDGVYWEDDYYHSDLACSQGDWNGELNPELRA